MKIRTLVVDDEPLARKRILSLLKSDEEIEVIGQCGDGRSAAAAITEQKPDLVFLDVQMPEMDGFAALETATPAHVPVVVFVTAYDKYAVRAFETHALDYLLKPFTRERLFDALRRVKEQLHRAELGIYEDRLIRFMQTYRPSNERLIIKCGTQLVFLRQQAIDWIEAAANYVCIHAGAEQHTAREKISTLEERLDRGKFVRIHRSLIVNADRIKALVPCGGGEYVLSMNNGRELPVGRTYREALEKFLGADGIHAQCT